MSYWSKQEEKRLINLVNVGTPNRDISKELNKSVDSVDSKLKRIKKNTKVKPRKALNDTKVYHIDNSHILNLVGMTLYWSEGSKQPNRIVEFVNSDPNTIKIFMKFLRSLEISESRLRARVKIYDFQNLQKCQKFWSDITDIPIDQFQKPIIRETKPVRNHMLTSYGTLTVRYHSMRLFVVMNNAINELKISLS